MDVMGIGATRLLNHIDGAGEVGNGPADVVDEQSKWTGLPDSAYAAENVGNSRGDSEMPMVTPLVMAHLRIAWTLVYRRSAELEVESIQAMAIEMPRSTLREVVHGRDPCLLFLLLLLPPYNHLAPYGTNWADQISGSLLSLPWAISVVVSGSFGHDVRQSRMDGIDSESDCYCCPWTVPQGSWTVLAAEGEVEAMKGDDDDGDGGGGRGATLEPL